MITFGKETNFSVWDDRITETLLRERTTETRFPINADEVLPRYLKSALEKKSRTEKKAEVFTPYSIVKKMNDMNDESFYDTIETYIKRKVLEVTCGEAPYLTTRYDVETGEEISVNDRTGILDRKLHFLPDGLGKENYTKCATVALKSVYGYEWQFDSLFLARRNLLMTTIEHYVDRYGEEPKYADVLEWATIISYNIIRMDGVSMCLPETKTPAMLMNWDTGRMERFDGEE